MLLHTVSQSPDAGPALASCLRSALPGSHILLLADGVYAGRRLSDTSTALTSSGCAVHALRADVEARGLAGRMATGIALISYDEFVTLATNCHAVQSWY
jgi:tRNA 2-thiouridine synthesizing protein B